MSIEPSEFRKALARFATGITVMTGRFPDGRPTGVTVNSFSSLSLTPPLVLFCLGKDTSVEQAFLNGRPFTVHVLAADQQHLSNQFATSKEQRFGDLPDNRGPNDCPMLDDCLVRLVCEHHSELDGGDHVIKVGRVIRIDHLEDTSTDREALIYFNGRYRGLAPGE